VRHPQVVKICFQEIEIEIAEDRGETNGDKQDTEGALESSGNPAQFTSKRRVAV
jgi:hypothetical protein